jgi:hypothetical protein
VSCLGNEHCMSGEYCTVDYSCRGL